MAEYPGFLHGAYGEINAVDSPNSTRNRRIKQAFVCIGTAPVHQVEGGANNVNKPILVNNIGEATFMRCTDLTSITIPNSVTSIGSSAFMDCI